MRFPQTFIEDLKRQADIVRIVLDYLPLKKAGTNWRAPCPFHKETKPSFNVNPAKEMFFCFGCHKGGTVFNFIMEMERVTFPEAVKIVAEKAGVPLPKMIDDDRFEGRKRDSDQVIELNQWALQWWQDQLQSRAAGPVRQYLKERGITDETAQTFRLGFAPDSWEALSTHLRQKGASQEQLEKSGLVVKKDEGGSYDRFRGRLIFPVFDVQGKPIAFGGRILDPAGDPKYLNSPETPAYIKGRNLYGLHLTRDEIRRQEFAILVEGYLDLIIPYQHGVRNVVASLGTALTPEQVKLMGRFARKVLVNYDGDRAGVAAAKRAIETLLTEDIEVKVLFLQGHVDPDEFIRKYGVAEYDKLQHVAESDTDQSVSSIDDFFRKYGANAYQQRRGEAQPHIQFVIDQAVRDRNLRNPVDKGAAVEETLPFIRAVRGPIQRREYFDFAMDRLQVHPDQRRELWHQVRGAASGDGTAVQKVFLKAERPTVAEEKLLGLLVANDELRRIILSRLDPADYEGLATAAIFRALTQLGTEEKEITFEELSEATADDRGAAEILPRILINEPAESFDESLADANSCLDALRLLRVDREIEELSIRIAQADRAGEAERRDQLVMEKLELSKRRSNFLPRGKAAN